MEPKGVSRDELLNDLVKILKDTYANIYMVPEKFL